MMTITEIKKFVQRLKEKNDIWEEQQVIDVFRNTSLNDALSMRFKELEILNKNIEKAKLTV